MNGRELARQLLIANILRMNQQVTDFVTSTSRRDSLVTQLVSEEALSDFSDEQLFRIRGQLRLWLRSANLVAQQGQAADEGASVLAFGRLGR